MREWTDLFRPSDGSSAPVRRFTVLKKEGHPILYLPQDGRMAETTLRLYPAQTLMARTLVRLLRICSWMGLWFSSETRNVPIDESSAFGGFLKSLVPGSQNVPSFGVLGGNIKVVGQRHALLLFDAAGNPAAVVKVGTSKEARQLIRAEQDFFFPQRPSFPGLPEAFTFYDDKDASAIAYRYVEGSSPTLQ